MFPPVRFFSSVSHNDITREGVRLGLRHSLAFPPPFVTLFLFSRNPSPKRNTA
ncbi:MAG: hypothetical protein ACXACR_16150 [Candidatus Hodarchaeales archaeon]